MDLLVPYNRCGVIYRVFQARLFCKDRDAIVNSFLSVVHQRCKAWLLIDTEVFDRNV